MAKEPVTRKLTAILYADVAEYSRLTGDDEEGTHKTLSVHLDAVTSAVETAGGSVVHFAGDAVLAEFRSVVVALGCALEMQRDLRARNAGLPDGRKLRFRVGINLGDVIVDRDDIYGDGVNIAARLESLAEPGGICISERVFEDVEGKFDCGFEYLGEQQVKNIERPVRAYKVLIGEGAATHPQTTSRPVVGAKRLTVAAAAVAAALAAVGLGGWLTLKKGDVPEAPPVAAPAPAGPALPEKPSIAVLPFNNMSGDAEQEYFSDGMTEDIITDLSKVSGLFVIARNSSFAYKGRSVNLQEVGRELGVRYVLEGSVRKAGGRVRINAQLIDAATGGHVWAERFDRDMADVFTLQDEVTRNIVSALAVKLDPEEKKRRGRKVEIDPEAYDLFLRGLELLRRFTPDTLAEANEFFHRAMMVDPRYGRAVSGVGFTGAMEVFLGSAADPERALKKAERFSEAALRIDPDVPQVHFGRSFVFERMKRYGESIAAARRAVELDPNYADGYAQLASALVQNGQPEEALAAVATAARLNPNNPFFYLDVTARAQFMLGRYAEAARTYAEVIKRNPEFVSGHRGLAASYAHLGQLDEAEWEANEVLALQPDFSLERMRQLSAFKRAEDLERYIDGLRKAGLPE